MRPSYTAVVIPAEEGGYCGYVLEMPNVNSQGESEEELIDNLKDALGMMLEYLQEQADLAVRATGGHQATFDFVS